MNKFTLAKSFIVQFEGRQPEWGPLGYITFKRTYARPIGDRTEEFWETLYRVVNGTYSIQKEYCQNLNLPWDNKKAQQSAQEMYQLMWDMKFLPPGRGLWSMGTSVIEAKGAAPLYNCSFISTDDIKISKAEPFCFLMDMSMLGVGVGFDTRGANKIKVQNPQRDDRTFVVPDTREGWISIVGTVINAYFGKGYLPATIDYSKIRPYGSPIKTFGGTASGPDPLMQLVDNDIHEILVPLQGKMLDSTAIVDLFNAISRCIVSGNVRRSASIALGDMNDHEFIALKDPNINQKRLEKWRWNSNNGIIAQVGMDYTELAERNAINGEPSAFWLENAQNYGRMIDGPLSEPDKSIIGCNPCSEISMESYEFCNVPETFPARHNSYAEYQRTLKFAYLYAKTVTLIPTHNVRVNAVQLRNRKIGLSMSGVVQGLHKHGTRKLLNWADNGYKYLRKLDIIYSNWLCVPTSKKITSVKPSGTISLLPGATPGVHFPYGKYYWRTIRMDSESELVKKLRRAGYRIVEGEGHNTSIVYFPIKEKDFFKSRYDVTMWEQLELVAQMQQYWADNQISVTITFRPEEANHIKTALELYETRLKSVSFLPLEGHNYKHAPYQPITKEEYDVAVSQLKPIDYSELTETYGYEHTYCDSDHCELPTS